MKGVIKEVIDEGLLDTRIGIDVNGELSDSEYEEESENESESDSDNDSDSESEIDEDNEVSDWSSDDEDELIDARESDVSESESEIAALGNHGPFIIGQPNQSGAGIVWQNNNKNKRILNNKEERENEAKEIALKEQSKKRVDQILIENPDFVSKISGIQRYDSKGIMPKEEGCMDGAIYTEEKRKTFFKLSTATSLDCEQDSKEQGDDALVEYVAFSILKKLGCAVPEVYLCKFEEGNKGGKYLFASEEVRNVITLKSKLMDGRRNVAEESFTYNESNLKTFLLLHMLGAQDLNSENLMIDSDGKIFCIDANFDAFYANKVAGDCLAKQYNCILSEVSESGGSVIAKTLGFELAGRNYKIKSLLTRLAYYNQLSEDFDTGYYVKKSRSFGIKPGLIQVVKDEEICCDYRLEELSKRVNSVLQAINLEELVPNTSRLGDRERNKINETLEKIKVFAIERLESIGCMTECYHKEQVPNPQQKQRMEEGQAPCSFKSEMSPEPEFAGQEESLIGG